MTRRRSVLEASASAAGTPSPLTAWRGRARERTVAAARSLLARARLRLARRRAVRRLSRSLPGGRRRRGAAALRSITAEGLAADELLYHDDEITVMPSWLEIDGRESIAVRAIVRLAITERAPPRHAAAVVCVLALVLAALSLLHYVGATLPPPVAWGALAASLALFLVAAHVAFVRPSRYALELVLGDGHRRRIERPTRAALLALHRALSRAMERQRGG